jgi:hypothetical protein
MATTVAVAVGKDADGADVVREDTKALEECDDVSYGVDSCQGMMFRPFPDLSATS